MKIYTDSQEVSFYKTNKKANGLHEIEVSSIKDFVWSYSLDFLALLDVKVYCADKHDEWQLSGIGAGPGDSNSEMQIDFTAGMSYSEIFREVLKYQQFNEDMLTDMASGGVCTYKDLSDDDSSIYKVTFNDQPIFGYAKTSLIISKTDAHADMMKGEWNKPTSPFGLRLALRGLSEATEMTTRLIFNS